MRSTIHEGSIKTRHDFYIYGMAEMQNESTWWKGGGGKWYY